MAQQTKAEMWCENCGGIVTGEHSQAQHDSGMRLHEYECQRCGASEKQWSGPTGTLNGRSTVRSVNCDDVTDRLRILQDNGIAPRVEDRTPEAHHNGGGA